MKERQIAQALGWFSVGLGMAELFAPRKLQDLVGVEDHENLLRTVGLREVASGVGLLAANNPRPWLWARVAGDAMDASLLLGALTSDRNDRPKVTGALLAAAGIAAIDLLAALHSADRAGRDDVAPVEEPLPEGTVQVVTVNRSPSEVYEFWRKLENLPRFMPHLRSVTDLGENRSRWIAQGPAGTNVEWEAAITEDRPGERIAWRSVAGAQLKNRGAVDFRPATGRRGTVVRVDFHYRAPGGALGASLAKLLGGAPEQRIAGELLRFKQLIETGEFARTDGQPAGRPTSLSRRYDLAVRS